MRVKYYDTSATGPVFEGESDLKVVDSMYVRVTINGKTELYPSAYIYRVPEEQDIIDRIKANRAELVATKDRLDKEMYQILNERSRRRQ